MKITATIITYNEEKNIERCLKSLSKVVDEIIVVDSGSIDNTVDICKKYNANIYFNLFINYGKQKNFAVSKASNRWIFSIDADEVLSCSLIDRIQKFRQSRFDADGYRIRRQNLLYGFMPKHWWEYQLRLFDKTKGKFTDVAVHEYVIVEGITKNIEEPIIHSSYDNISDHIIRINKYSELEANKPNKNINFIDLYIKPIYIFLLLLFRKGLILDKIPGIHVAFMTSFYRYLVSFRLWKNNKENIKTLIKHQNTEK